METTKEIAEKLGLVRKFKPSGLYKGKYISSLVPTTLVLLRSLPGLTRHLHTPRNSGFGPNFCHYQTCRAWVGARLQFRNTYHKGFSLFMGQTRYHAPDENSCLFWWADHQLRSHSHFYLRALSPPPHFPIRFTLFLYLRIYRFKSAISIFPSFNIHLQPTLAPSVIFTPTWIPHISSTCHSPSHPPTIPSTALRCEYPFKFQKWNFKRDMCTFWGVLVFEVVLVLEVLGLRS